MGLDITVGFLADLATNDAEFLDEFREDFAAANRLLADNDFPTWKEPEQADWEPLSFDMIGYSGLHYLRRIAASLAAGRDLPDPGDEDAAEDPLLDAYYDAAVGKSNRGFFRRRQPEFDFRFNHLVLHADNDGFYAPVAFDDVLFGDVVGGMLGSSHVLLRECEELRRALQIPDTLSYEDEELWEAVATQGRGEGWRRFGIESFTCVALHEAALGSVERGAAIVFH